MLHCLMHGLTVKLVVGEANLTLRYVALINGLSLLQDQGNSMTIIRIIMKFIKGVTVIIINKKLCCADRAK